MRKAKRVKGKKICKITDKGNETTITLPMMLPSIRRWLDITGTVGNGNYKNGRKH